MALQGGFWRHHVASRWRHNLASRDEFGSIMLFVCTTSIIWVYASTIISNSINANNIAVVQRYTLTFGYLPRPMHT